jgi:hypothetical protein
VVTITHVNSLYTIAGEHTYAHPGTYHGEVIVSAGDATPVRADFTASWPTRAADGSRPLPRHLHPVSLHHRRWRLYATSTSSSPDAQWSAVDWRKRP